MITNGGIPPGSPGDAAMEDISHRCPMPPGERVAAIRSAIAEALAPVALDVVDESHLHAGHAGARDGRGHFRVDVVSAAFEGMGPLARHRAVYAAVGDLMVTDIHALAIVARVPGDVAV